MRWRDVGKLDCTIARTLSVIGDRWTLLVLRDAFLGTRRFDTFQASLGITRHRLADRLRKLVQHGVLRRERYQESPPRFEYRLTEKGHDLYGVIVTTLRLTCEHCGDAVTARDMTARPAKRYADTARRHAAAR